MYLTYTKTIGREVHGYGLVYEHDGQAMRHLFKLALRRHITLHELATLRAKVKRNRRAEQLRLRKHQLANEMQSIMCSLALMGASCN